MIDLDKVSEGVHYELVPVENNPNELAWHVRILEGDYPETVISFGRVAFMEDGEHLSFDFKVVSSPDDTLTEDTIELQDFASQILEDVLERAEAENRLVTSDDK